MKLKVSQNELDILFYESPDLDLNDKYEVFIGRSEDCHIHLEDSKISRYHAVIEYSEGKWTLVKKTEFGDLLVNAIGEEKHILRVGDNITISSFSIKVEELNEINLDTDIVTEVSSDFEDAVGNDSLPEGTMEMPKPGEGEDISDLDDDSLLEDGPSENDDEEDGGLVFNDDNDEGSENTNFNDGEEDSFNNDEEGGFSEEGEPSFDSGFVDEEDNGFGEGSSESTQVLNSFITFSLKLSGDLAPYDRFTIEDEEVIIGRDPEKCQIVLNDPEISGEHAKVTKTMINCFIEDLNSSNGTYVNGERINKVELENGDEFTIGETTFALDVSSDLIEEEDGSLMPVEDDQEIEMIEEIEEEVDFDDYESEFDGDFAVESVEEKSFLKNPEKRKKLIIGLVVVAGLSMFIEDKPKKKKSTGKKGEATKTTKVGDTSTKKPKEQKKKELSPEEKSMAESSYQLGKAYVSQGRYAEAQIELDKVWEIDPLYTPSLSILRDEVQEGLKNLERKRRELEAAKERVLRLKKIKELVDKAKEAVKKREVIVAQSLFTEIAGLDPENIEVTRLKLEIEAYEKEQERKKLEAARVKALREKMVDKLKPGKLHYIKKEWFKAIIKLEKFLDEKGMPEDLVKEATDMLSESKKALSEQIDPLVGKARSLKEGQDLKASYDVYLEVLQIDPGHEEALSEIENIKQTLENRSKKVYREALISESLSLFKEAKEKFEQVQQISPTDSEYYQKATEKLKDYLE
jgi:pSer/pThr/pTyr-binding forkhead associated (FHA) protein